jgi:ADP-heptose:LPS heptosyltransferase
VTERILVIKLGALGDFILALAPFQAIRQHHPDAAVTLLTTQPFEALARASGWFDDIWIDSRPQLWQVAGWWALRSRLRSAGFDRVYDLQTSDRSGWYFRLFGGTAPEWSGVARGCSHPHRNPARDDLHTVERQAEQLAAAGIPAVPAPSLDWLDADVDGFALPDRFVAIAPGGAAHRPAKRWPADRSATLAGRLAGQGLAPVILGGPDEAAAAAAIRAACPAAVSLIGRTSLLDIAGIARRARAAVGNDTGPMHIAAAVGCPSLVLFSAESDPALCGQRGPAVAYLRRPALADLTVDEVEAALRLR